MEIITIPVGEIIRNERNAKMHPDWHIEQIIASIQDFGFNDPVAVDENNVLIEGHGRLQALEAIGEKTVPAIRLSHLSEEQKNAYILAHNKLTINTGFDLFLLQEALDSIKSIDMTSFGFEENFQFSFADHDDFLTDRKKSVTEEDDEGEEAPGEGKTVKCPHCGEEFEIE